MDFRAFHHLIREHDRPSHLFGSLSGSKKARASHAMPWSLSDDVDGDSDSDDGEGEEEEKRRRRRREEWMFARYSQYICKQHCIETSVDDE